MTKRTGLVRETASYFFWQCSKWRKGECWFREIFQNTISRFRFDLRHGTTAWLNRNYKPGSASR